jgi:hypothetical protein
MSFLTDTDVNKRTRNLFVAFEQAAAFLPGITLVPTAADMTYFAVYLAADPTVVDIGGTFNPAQTGAAAALSNGDLTVNFSGTCCSVGTLNNNFSSVCWEFEIGPGNGAFAVGSYIAGLAPAYNANAYAGNSGTFSSYYQSDGTIISFVGGTVGNPALVSGDVVGFLYDNNAGIGSFYLNGVLISTFGVSNSNMRPMATAP